MLLIVVPEIMVEKFLDLVRNEIALLMTIVELEATPQTTAQIFNHFTLKKKFQWKMFSMPN